MGIIKRQSIQSSIATYIGVLIAYVNLIILFPKFLSTDQLGLTRVMYSVALIFSQCALAGISFTLLRFFPYFNDKKNKHHGFFSFTLLIGIIGFFIFSLLFFVFRNPVQNFFEQKSALFNDYYYFIFPMALFLLLFEIFFVYARSLFKTVVPITIREVVLRIFQTVALVCYILHWVDFFGFMLLFLGSYFVYLLIMVLYLIFLNQFFIVSKIRLKGRASFRQLMRYSMFVYTGSIAAIYTANIDIILLSALSGLTSTAVYSIAFFVGNIIQIPGRTMNQVAIPIVADAWKNDDKKKLEQLYSQTSLNQLIIGGFIFLIIWINTDLLLSLLPADYAAAKWAIFIVAIGKLIDLATGINGEIILYSKHVKVNLVTNLFLIIVATLTNYFLIPVYGVEGSAFASALSMFCYNGIRMIFLFYRYRMQPFSFQTLKALLILIAAFALFYLSPHVNNLWINGAIQSTLIGGLFIVAIISFRISKEVNESFQWFRSFLTAK